MSPINIEKKQRNLMHIEFLRLIAIYLVIFNHTQTNGFFYFSIVPNSRFYWFYMFTSIACKVAVPIFFMISGALLLGKDESLRDLYKNRILKFTGILIVVSLLYQIYYNWYYNDLELNTLNNLFKTIYTRSATAALWYLYSYIGMLAMLPLLRKMVRAMEKKDYIYLASWSLFICGIVPVMQYYLSKGTIYLTGNFSVPLFTATNITYVIMGYFFEHVLDEKYYTAKTALILATSSFFCIVICCFMTQYKAALTGELSESTSQTFYSVLIAIPAYTLYFCTKLIFTKKKLDNRIANFIKCAGGTTFGIYLLESILRQKLHFIFDQLQPIIHTFPACILYVLIVLIAGGIITFVLKRIPLFNKLL